MEPWLREVDRTLGDEEIVEAVMTVMRRRWQQSARRGRAGTPAEVVLRMLALKHLRDWSYDELEREVMGSLVYRRFCRIDAGKVPDAKTTTALCRKARRHDRCGYETWPPGDATDPCSRARGRDAHAGQDRQHLRAVGADYPQGKAGSANGVRGGGEGAGSGGRHRH